MTDAHDHAPEGGRSALQWMLLVGVLTFFLLPFMQLWSVEAVPMFLSDSYRQAAVAAENLMAQAQSFPFNESQPATGFRPIKSGGAEDLQLEGRVEVQPHPDLAGMTLVRVQVRWGWFFFRKMLTLESAVTQTRP